MKDEIIGRLKEYTNEIYTEVTVIETILSTVIIIEDKESYHEEIVTISDNKVHIVNEGRDYTKLTLEEYYKIVKENYF